MYERVDRRERMERDGREAVVFDVEGHLPGQQAKGAVRIGRARIGEHVVAQRAARMLGHQEQPKERLSGEYGEYPIGQRVGSVQGERYAKDGQVAEPENARLA